ncbi:hypothetical protein KEM55_006140, partial [Ascosphaera atra]
LYSSSSSSSSSSPPPEAPSDSPPSPSVRRRKWPPDMSKLSPKQQFRLERKYRRRAKLKYARPTFTKVTKLLQYGMITFVVVYSVFFLELEEGMGHGENPFAPVSMGAAGIRAWAKNLFSGAFSTTREEQKQEKPSDAPEEAASRT